MPALPGEHYCANHQGNTSHYDPDNCTVCKLQKEVDRLKVELNQFERNIGFIIGGDN